MKHLAPRRLFAIQNSEVSIQKSDLVDYARAGDKITSEKEEEVFSPLSAILITVSMVTYVTDVASSVSVCYLLYFGEPFWWFLMTLIPLLSSLTIINVFSVRWYVHDMKEEDILNPRISPAHWVMRIFFHVMFLGPVMRYLELFCYGLHSCEESEPNREQFKVLVLQEDRDISLLTLVGSFVKSAPQLVLQLYILTQNKTMVGISTTRAQIVTVVMSIVELSLAMASYHRALRRSIPSKMNMTRLGTAMQFLSHCFIIGCRVLVLAAFASLYGHWLLVLCTIHWVLMTSWLLFQRTSFCSSGSGEPRRCDELWFNVVVGVIYIFCFLNVKDEPTRWKYTIYYLMVWLENIVLVVLWYLKADSTLWYHLPLPLGVLISFAVGLLVLVLYYRFLHPNKVSKVTSFVKLPS